MNTATPKTLPIILWGNMIDLYVDKEIQDTLLATARRNGATHIVRAVNMDMCSSQLGQMTFLCVGPSCTYKNPDECAGKWLNDLPSQRQYFQDAAEVPA